MDSYQLQAEQEIWAGIAAYTPPAAPARSLYRQIVARYRGNCAGCGSRVCRGDSILYSDRTTKSRSVFGIKCGCAATLTTEVAANAA